MDYLLHILILAAIYSILAVSLDLLAGHAGLLAVCQAAFWGLGAYASAVLTVDYGVYFPLGILAGMCLGVLASFLVSLPSLRLTDDYFVIATFGFQIIAFAIFNNWASLTRGPLGIPGIPPPTIFGWRVDSQWKFLLLAVIGAVAAYIVVNRISSSPFGRVLHAIREDEIFAASLGKNTLRFKVTAFAVSAALAAMAGSLYAHYITYIDPTNFTLTESILIISMVIVGGAGSRWGPLTGVLVLVVMPESLRFIGLPSAIAANVRQIMYGVLLVVMMLFRPQGLAGQYRFGR
ncbi:MAG: branched-chain amino acid ABC transporter permease [Tepidisphaeraceae bacterium]|jgi:branched-chain amino acid transport system permease protein